MHLLTITLQFARYCWDYWTKKEVINLILYEKSLTILTKIPKVSDFDYCIAICSYGGYTRDRGCCNSGMLYIARFIIEGRGVI